MALVHEKLYCTENFKYIKVKDYFFEIFDDLIENYYNG